MAVKIGADVEFVFEKDGLIEDASRHLRFKDRFGTDGCSSVVEIRPFPSEDPRYVINSLSRMMKMRAKRQPVITKFNWVAGSIAGGRPVGGHIHFGTGSTPRANEVKYLDTFLATAVALTDDSLALERRQSSSYGLLGAYRSQPWGWEYRTLPSFIVDKRFAEGVLTLAQKLVEHCLQNNHSNEEVEELVRVRLTEDEKLNYRMGKLTISRTKFQDRVAFLKRHIVGVDGCKPIDYMFRCVTRAEAGMFTIAHTDIKKSWGIKKPEVVKHTLKEVWEVSV
jgi:hypothetical protein